VKQREYNIAIAESSQTMKAKTNSKPITVRVSIKPGPASLAQNAVWCKFWQKLIAEVQNDQR